MRASRRTRFTDVTECTVLYEKPCGCEGNVYYLPDGCRWFTYGDGLSTKWDLFECRQCGAVWTLHDAHPAFLLLWES